VLPPEPAEPESPDSGAAERRREALSENNRRRLLADPGYHSRWRYARKAEDPLGFWRKRALVKARRRALEQGVPFCLTESDLLPPLPPGDLATGALGHNVGRSRATVWLV